MAHSWALVSHLRFFGFDSDSGSGSGSDFGLRFPLFPILFTDFSLIFFFTFYFTFSAQLWIAARVENWHMFTLLFVLLLCCGVCLVFIDFVFLFLRPAPTECRASLDCNTSAEARVMRNMQIPQVMRHNQFRIPIWLISEFSWLILHKLSKLSKSLAACKISHRI